MSIAIIKTAAVDSYRLPFTRPPAIAALPNLHPYGDCFKVSPFQQ